LLNQHQDIVLLAAMAHLTLMDIMEFATIDVSINHSIIMQIIQQTYVLPLVQLHHHTFQTQLQEIVFYFVKMDILLKMRQELVQ
jgi:hypothetical protein